MSTFVDIQMSIRVETFVIIIVLKKIDLSGLSLGICELSGLEWSFIASFGGILVFFR
jgi:hypothetical protein